MSIAVFGGTGPTGKLVIQELLAAEHDVMAFARNPRKLDFEHVRLRVSEGELEDGEAIARAISGVEAVISLLGPSISLLGPSGKTTGQPITRGTSNILAAMKKHGVRRFILVSTPSASDPLDGPDLKFRLLVAVGQLLVRSAYDEVVSVARLVRASDADWTLVRVPLLTNGPKTGCVKVGYLGQGTGTFLSRANMADFMVRQLGDTTWVRKAPAISNGS